MSFLFQILEKLFGVFPPFFGKFYTIWPVTLPVMVLGVTDLAHIDLACW